MKTVFFTVMCLMAVPAFGQSRFKQDKAAYEAQLGDEQRQQDVADSLRLAKEQLKYAQMERKMVAKYGNAYYKAMFHNDSNAYDDSKPFLVQKYGLPAYKRAVKPEVWLGMPDELCEHGLGTPNRINNNFSKGQKTTTWVYSGYSPGCVGNCDWLDYRITFLNHKAVAITEGQ